MTAIPRTNETPYMIQLDALRALAVLGVLIQHFIPESLINSVVLLGYLGVRFFFVLSGFLITLILLRCKTTIDANQQKPGWTLKQFHIRRFLRIFPIYYLTIAVTYILKLEGTQETLWWNLTYTTNIYFAKVGEWVGSVSHFWALSVEEQFYIFWPFLIFWIPEKHLFKTILGSIFVAPLFRLLLLGLDSTNGTLEYVLPLSHLDSLGMGAFLALLMYQTTNTQLLKNFVYGWSFWSALSLFIGFRLLYAFHQQPVFQLVIDDTVSAIFYTGIIYRATKGFGGWIGKVLEMKPLLYIGKISYGIYLYHLFVPYVYVRIAYQWGFSEPQSQVNQFMLFTILTLFLASLSWFFLEKPINDLKKYFPYSK